MGDVVAHDRAIRLSISTLASEFGVTRETAAKRLAQSNVAPDGKRNGYPVYRLGPATRAILGGPQDAEVCTDPAKMKPTERHAHFRAENERLQFETDTKKLILASEVEFEMRALVNGVVKALETLPDRCERDTRCTPEVTQFLIDQVHEIRREMANNVRMTDAEDEDVRASA